MIQYGQNFLKIALKFPESMSFSYSFVQGKISWKQEISSKISWNQEISWKITTLHSYSYMTTGKTVVLKNCNLYEQEIVVQMFKNTASFL